MSKILVDEDEYNLLKDLVNNAVKDWTNHASIALADNIKSLKLLKKLVKKYEDPKGFYYSASFCWSIPQELNREIDNLLENPLYKSRI